MTFADRFNLALMRKGLSRRRLADLIGVSQQSVQYWATGRNAPSPERLVALARVLGVTPEWLMTGAGDENAPASTSNVRVYMPEEADTPPAGVIAIPEYELTFSAGAGAEPEPEWVIVEDATPFWYREDWFTKRRLLPSRCKRALVRGDSMEPIISSGDHIMFYEELDPSVGCVQVVEGKIYVISVGNEMRVKRLTKVKNGLRLISENAAMFPPETYTGEECDRIRIYGRVIEITRSLI